MEIERVGDLFTVCKVSDVSVIMHAKFTFIASTDEEISLVCPTVNAPAKTIERSDGWRAFRVKGVLDFSLVGILAKISAVLAESNISIFAVSTFNTDYIFVKAEHYERAIELLGKL